MRKPVTYFEIESVLRQLAEIEIQYDSELERRAAEEGLQDSIKFFGDLQKNKPIFALYDPSRGIREQVNWIVHEAYIRGLGLAIGKHLIGATLALRFPQEKIENLSPRAADNQINRPGDFLLGSFALHVTVAPMPAVFAKCQRNIHDGFRPYLLVPEKVLQGARQNAELNVSGPIEVESIESFVAQNILEVAEFSSQLLPGQFLRLLEIYNERVDQVEIDKSMMIEIPQNLVREAAS